MDEQTRLELDYIKKAIDELKEMLKANMDREEERSRRLSVLEQYKAINEIQALNCQKGMAEDFDRVWNKVRELEGRGKNTLQQAVLWTSLAVGSSSLIMWVIKVFGK